MIQTFNFETEIDKKRYHQTVYAIDIKTAVDKWKERIVDLQNECYSFNAKQVQEIRQQFSNGSLKVHVVKEPYFLTFQAGDRSPVVHITRVSKGEPDILAKVTYLTTDQGGKKWFVTSGYRPHVKFEGRKELTSGEQIFVDRDKVFPGETATAEIRILGKDFFRNCLYVGLRFEFAEASHLVGHGEILEILNPDLRKTDE